eukprot:TRINITY_DN39367_c0_g1_i1.p1 TRINITY_DN39367_c0_g1~~TRINITY_DN39367_c0_g1_i1.p1  ORF type:complete len:387 (+),score=50.97 TRINITY_DN39367_c0_g1_i1:110-1270(+)
MAKVSDQSSRRGVGVQKQRGKTVQRRIDSGREPAGENPRESNKPWLWKRIFASKSEIFDHWQALHQLTEDACSNAIVTNTDDLSLGYTPGTGWKYSVVGAVPTDNDDLSSLCEEFVKGHIELFEKEKAYRDVDFNAWCDYLGFSETISKHTKRVSNKKRMDPRFDLRELCQKGCILKCIAEVDDTDSQADETFQQNGSGTTKIDSRRLIRRQSSTGSNVSQSSGPGLDAQAGVVGYINFTLEDCGTDVATRRSSKRLKRKRGESTGEYIKVNHLLVTGSHRSEGLGLLLLASVLHRVKCMQPRFAQELFLTVVQKNAVAVSLYERMGLFIAGQNTTYLAKAASDKSRPIVWYQMSILEPERAVVKRARENGLELPSENDDDDDEDD